MHCTDGAGPIVVVYRMWCLQQFHCHKPKDKDGVDASLAVSGMLHSLWENLLELHQGHTHHSYEPLLQLYIPPCLLIQFVFCNIKQMSKIFFKFYIWSLSVFFKRCDKFVNPFRHLLLGKNRKIQLLLLVATPEAIWLVWSKSIILSLFNIFIVIFIHFLLCFIYYQLIYFTFS